MYSGIQKPKAKSQQRHEPPSRIKREVTIDGVTDRSTRPKRVARPEPKLDDKLSSYIKCGAGSWFQNTGGAGYLIDNARLDKTIQVIQHRPNIWHISWYDAWSWLTCIRDSEGEAIPARQITAALRTAQNVMDADLSLVQNICVDAFSEDPILWLMRWRYEINYRPSKALLRLIGIEPAVGDTVVRYNDDGLIMGDIYWSVFSQDIKLAEKDLDFLSDNGGAPDHTKDEPEILHRKIDLLQQHIQRVVMIYRRSGALMSRLKGELEALDAEAEAYGDEYA